MHEREEKHKITSEKRLRSSTLKLQTTKKGIEGAKIPIQYNDDGDKVCEREEKHKIASKKGSKTQL